MTSWNSLWVKPGQSAVTWMARNKRPQSADEKRAEIVAPARQLFIDAGYDATSMSRLAKEPGVAPNTIYWYFGDKDDVLIAVLTAAMEDVWPQYQDVASDPIGKAALGGRTAHGDESPRDDGARPCRALTGRRRMASKFSRDHRKSVPVRAPERRSLPPRSWTPK
jgi:AcrR family transcriptional regulator